VYHYSVKYMCTDIAVVNIESKVNNNMHTQAYTQDIQRTQLVLNTIE